MHPVLNAYLSQAIVDRREEAERLRRTRVEQAEEADSYDAVTVRLARGNDAGAVRRLAELDGRHAPEGPMLVAEVHGELLAARSLSGEGSIADPFHPTAHLIELLGSCARPPAKRIRRWTPSTSRRSEMAPRCWPRAPDWRRRPRTAPSSSNPATDTGGPQPTVGKGDGSGVRAGTAEGVPLRCGATTAPGRVEARRREPVSGTAPPGAATVRVPARRPAPQLLISRRRRQRRQRIDVRMSATGPPHAWRCGSAAERFRWSPPRRSSVPRRPARRA